MEESGWEISQLVYGLLISGVGFIIVWKSDFFLKNFGRVPVAEKYLGSDGGTRLFYKLLGILVMVIGIMYAFDLLEAVGEWTIDKFFT